MNHQRCNNLTRVELRSKKIRKLLGEKPPLLVQWGTLGILFVFLAIVCVVCLIPLSHCNGETWLKYFLKKPLI